MGQQLVKYLLFIMERAFATKGKIAVHHKFDYYIEGM